MSTRRFAIGHHLSEIARLTVILGLITAAVLIHQGVIAVAAEPSASIAPNLTPDELKSRAADILSQATAEGGAGYTFEIVQTSTIVARPGGPLVEVPDPADRHKSLGQVESYLLSTYLESGSVSPGGFWAEIRRGPDKPDVEPDFGAGDVEMAALARDGKTYRDDGDGWYPTADPPGIGLDPSTASLLPSLLRNAADPKDVPVDATKPVTASPAVVRALDATTTVKDVPGVIAVDLAAFTELTTPATFAFDDGGRLIALTITARNTGLERFDLMVATTITFRYPDGPPELPKPEPVYVAPVGQ